MRRPPDEINLLDCAVLIAKHAYPQLVGAEILARFGGVMETAPGSMDGTYTLTLFVALLECVRANRSAVASPSMRAASRVALQSRVHCGCVQGSERARFCDCHLAG